MSQIFIYNTKLFCPLIIKNAIDVLSMEHTLSGILKNFFSGSTEKLCLSLMMQKQVLLKKWPRLEVKARSKVINKPSGLIIPKSIWFYNS